MPCALPCAQVDPCDAIFIKVAHGADELGGALRSLSGLCEQEDRRAGAPPVRLVIVDSIAAAFRGDEDRTDAAARAGELFAHSARLKTLASRWGLAVVLVNQVTARVRKSDSLDSRRELNASPPPKSFGAFGTTPTRPVPGSWVKPYGTRL